ncbi:hypothetical protein RB595_010044 [Gaeumannomyces hyphopodioides]
MDVYDDCITHSERWDAHGLDDQRLQRVAQVQEYLEQGLLAPDTILKRLTDALTPSLAGNSIISGISLGGIRRRFDELKDRQTEGITKHSFIAGLSASSSSAAATPALGALFDLVSWHVSFPFNVARAADATVDEPGLVRAVALLSPREAGPRWTLAPHSSFDVREGAWGPHTQGWIVTARHAGAKAWRRRVFRALAAQTTTTAAGKAVTTIPVPRFFMFQPRDGGNGEDDEGQQVVVVHDEDERTVDLLDVLALTAPNGVPKSGPPFRESFDGLLGDLMANTQQQQLSELAVPKKTLGSLLSLLLGAPGTDRETALPSADSPHNALVQELLSSGDGEVLGFKQFNELLQNCQTDFQAGLDKFFDNFFG